MLPCATGAKRNKNALPGRLWFPCANTAAPHGCFFGCTLNTVDIEFDGVKRTQTLDVRGFDFLRAAEVFAGRTLTRQDDRRDYAEERFVTVGKLDGRHVVIVWTQRGEARRIISMRKANEREIENVREALGGSG